MGINYSSALFLIGEQRRGIDFSNTLTLGRQSIYMSKHERRQIDSLLSRENSSTPIYADYIFKTLGAKHLDSMDASSYENATILHDLNAPLPSEHHSRWSTVFDGGTLEHVFNFPEAIRSCMAMVRMSGHFISVTPWNNFAGHGFYQFSPELFFRVLCPENGFIVERMLIYQNPKWYSVRDPAVIKSRVEYFGQKETLLFICARKITATPLFSRPPQQSDYSKAWLNTKPENEENRDRQHITSHSLVSSLRVKWRLMKKRYLHPISPTWASPVATDKNVPL